MIRQKDNDMVALRFGVWVVRIGTSLGHREDESVGDKQVLILDAKNGNFLGCNKTER